MAVALPHFSSPRNRDRLSAAIYGTPKPKKLEGLNVGADNNCKLLRCTVDLLSCLGAALATLKGPSTQELHAGVSAREVVVHVTPPKRMCSVLSDSIALPNSKLHGFPGQLGHICELQEDYMVLPQGLSRCFCETPTVVQAIQFPRSELRLADETHCKQYPFCQTPRWLTMGLPRHRERPMSSLWPGSQQRGSNRRVATLATYEAFRSCITGALCQLGACCTCFKKRVG